MSMDSEEGQIQVLEFPGHDRFTEEQVVELSRLIAWAQESQPKAVIEICEKTGIGWDASGYPETSEISEVEAHVRRKGCFLIAYETSRMLSANLSSQEVVGVVMDGAPIYEDIPERVRVYVRGLYSVLIGEEISTRLKSQTTDEADRMRIDLYVMDVVKAVDRGIGDEAELLAEIKNGESFQNLNTRMEVSDKTTLLLIREVKERLQSGE